MADEMLSVVIDGKERFLGNKTPHLSGDPIHFKGVYGDFPNQPMLTRDQWKPVTWRQYIPEVMDQDGIGACNAFCTIMTVHLDRSKRQLPYRCLSPGFLYGKINGGVDHGSGLEDALHEMHTGGTCYASTVDVLDWRHRSAAAVEEAKQNLILEAYWCPTFDHLGSASQCGYICNTGLWWYDGDDPDSNGWLPTRGRGNRGGHSVPCIGVCPRPGSQEWGSETVNSWGSRWGMNGRAFIPESRFTSDGMSAGMWAICASTIPALPVDLPALQATT